MDIINARLNHVPPGPRSDIKPGPIRKVANGIPRINIPIPLKTLFNPLAAILFVFSFISLFYPTLPFLQVARARYHCASANRRPSR